MKNVSASAACVSGGPTQIERIVWEVDTVGIADFEGDGEGQARYTLAGLGDHGAVGVDTGDPSVRPYPLDEAARLVPESAAHIQDLIAFADWAGIEHLPPDLLDRGIPVNAVKPAEGGLGVNRLTCLPETLVQAAHGALADDRCFCGTQN